MRGGQPADPECAEGAKGRDEGEYGGNGGRSEAGDEESAERGTGGGSDVVAGSEPGVGFGELAGVDALVDAPTAVK
jgi:hypothetical protein